MNHLPPRLEVIVNNLKKLNLKLIYGGPAVGKVIFPKCSECDGEVLYEAPGGTCPSCKGALSWNVRSMLANAMKQVKLLGDRAIHNRQVISQYGLLPSKKKPNKGKKK